MGAAFRQPNPKPDAHDRLHLAVIGDVPKPVAGKPADTPGK